MARDAEEMEGIDGIDDAITKVYEWFKPLVTGPEVQGSVRVQLSLAGRNGDKDVVHDTKYKLDEEAKDFVEDLVDEAVRDIERANYMGDNKYAVRVRVNGFWKRVNFTLTVPRTKADDRRDFEAEIETPSARGIAHQQMRHTEVAYNQVIKMAALGHDAKDRLILRHEKTIQDLTTENRTLRLERDEVQSTAWIRKLREREIEDEREDERKRKEVVGKILTTGGSMLLSKALGMPIDPAMLVGQLTGGEEPQGATATDHARDLELIDGFIEDLTGEHVQQLMTVLPQAQVVRLQELYSRSQTRKSSGTYNPPNGSVNGTSVGSRS